MHPVLGVRFLLKIWIATENCFRALLRRFSSFAIVTFTFLMLKKTIRILKIYRQWLIAQEDLDFNDLYEKFWDQYERDITGVSLLLLLKGHNKEREIKRIDAWINTINQCGTSYIFNDVQSNAVGFAENNYLYSATRKSLEEIYSAVKKNKIVNIVVISKTIWEFIQNPTLTLII